MKIFGVSIVTIVLIFIAYFIGAKKPGLANKLMGM